VIICCNHTLILISSGMTGQRLCDNSNTTGVTSIAGTEYCFTAYQFTPNFKRVSCYSILIFVCSVLLPTICHFVLIHLVIILSGIIRFRTSDYPLMSSNFPTGSLISLTTTRQNGRGKDIIYYFNIGMADWKIHTDTELINWINIISYDVFNIVTVYLFPIIVVPNGTNN